MIRLLIPCYAQAEATTFRPSETDGYAFTHKDCSAVVHRGQSGENSLHGMFYFLNQFDTNQQYPVLIFSHGFNNSSYADTDDLPHLTDTDALEEAK